MTKETLRKAIALSLTELEHRDSHLFGSSDYEYAGRNPEFSSKKGTTKISRKLHEVCINHRLAVYLEKNTPAILKHDEKNYPLFVDIEFNRKGNDPKRWQTQNGKFVEIRPDIIIHNRKNGTEGFNFLVVECKKAGARKKSLEEDLNKIKKFIEDNDYSYHYGLQVIYNSGHIGELNFLVKDNNGKAKLDKDIQAELNSHLERLKTGKNNGMTFEEIFGEG